MVKRAPILNYPSRTPSNYQFIRYMGDGLALFKEGLDGKAELFVTNKNHASWGLFYNGTHWEFCRTSEPTKSEIAADLARKHNIPVINFTLKQDPD